MTGSLASSIVRLHVNLSAETAEALQQLAAQSGRSLTEVVRRAITIYNFVDEELQLGHEIRTFDPASGNARILILLP